MVKCSCLSVGTSPEQPWWWQDPGDAAWGLISVLSTVTILQVALIPRTSLESVWQFQRALESVTGICLLDENKSTERKKRFFPLLATEICHRNMEQIKSFYPLSSAVTLDVGMHWSTISNGTIILGKGSFLPGTINLAWKRFFITCQGNNRFGVGWFEGKKRGKWGGNVLDCCGTLPGIYSGIVDGERAPAVNPQGNGVWCTGVWLRGAELHLLGHGDKPQSCCWDLPCSTRAPHWSEISCFPLHLSLALTIAKGWIDALRSFCCYNQNRNM